MHLSTVPTALLCEKLMSVRIQLMKHPGHRELCVIAFPLPRALHLAGDTKGSRNEHLSMPYQASHHSARSTQLALHC